jgi:hypothetical protein
MVMNNHDETITVDEWPLFWRGRAQALRLLNDKAKVPNEATLARAEAYETCADELSAALATPSPIQGAGHG